MWLKKSSTAILSEVLIEVAASSQRKPIETPESGCAKNRTS